MTERVGPAPATAACAEPGRALINDPDLQPCWQEEPVSVQPCLLPTAPAGSIGRGDRQPGDGRFPAGIWGRWPEWGLRAVRALAVALFNKREGHPPWAEM